MHYISRADRFPTTRWENTDTERVQHLDFLPQIPLGLDCSLHLEECGGQDKPPGCSESVIGLTMLPGKSPHTLTGLQRLHYGEHTPDCLSHPEVVPNPCSDHVTQSWGRKHNPRANWGPNSDPQAQFVPPSSVLPSAFN